MSNLKGNTYSHTKRGVYTPTKATRKQDLIATVNGWAYARNIPYNPRNLPVDIGEVVLMSTHVCIGEADVNSDDAAMFYWLDCEWIDGLPVRRP